MAKQLFPELARGCRAFLRHKDVLMSPRVLRSYNIQVVQARHGPCPTCCLTVGDPLPDQPQPRNTGVCGFHSEQWGLLSARRWARAPPCKLDALRKRM